jgi:hypothetical protein
VSGEDDIGVSAVPNPLGIDLGAEPRGKVVVVTRGETPELMIEDQQIGVCQLAFGAQAAQQWLVCLDVCTSAFDENEEPSRRVAHDAGADQSRDRPRGVQPFRVEPSRDRKREQHCDDGDGSRYLQEFPR